MIFCLPGPPKISPLLSNIVEEWGKMKPPKLFYWFEESLNFITYDFGLIIQKLREKELI